MKSAQVGEQSLFTSTDVERLKNPSGEIYAVIAYSEPPSGVNTVPFYSVRLETKESPEKWSNYWDVWSSQVREKPKIQWLDNQNIQITHSTTRRIWEYAPAVLLNGDHRYVHVKVLPVAN